jgi:hypothetical protein
VILNMLPAGKQGAVVDIASVASNRVVERNMAR